MKKNKILLSILIIFFLVNMIVRPAFFLQTALDGISAWAFNVLPCVLPFMFFTQLLSALDTMSTLTRPFSIISKKLFRTPPISVYTFFMAVLSGYPVGTKMVADQYMQGQISKEEAFKMTSFCSTSGPMFIIGAVGIGMFNSSRVGYILFFSHVFGAFLNGLLFRNLKLQDGKMDMPLPNQLNSPKNVHKEKDKLSLSDIITNSTLSILSVGCIITIFFIIIGCFSPVFSLLPTPFGEILTGLIEITKGCLVLSKLGGNLSIIFCSFIISFGGISTLLQSLTMLEEIKMPVKLFVFQKLMHAVFATIITMLLVLV